MDRVLDRLWIGSTRDITPTLGALGFSGVLDLRDNMIVAQFDCMMFRLPNRDGDPWNEEQVVSALDFIERRIKLGKVLVACAAGMSRSASMVIGYLVRSGWDVGEAFERVKQARPKILPVPKMLQSVLEVVKAS